MSTHGDLSYLTPEERRILDEVIAAEPLWRPHPLNRPQQQAFNVEVDVLGFGGAAGGGKEIRLDEKVPTPTGWKLNGDLKAGDWVFDECGKPQRVLVAHRARTPPTAYRLTFCNGQQIETSGTHRWLTFTDKERAQLLRLSPEFRAARKKKRPSNVSGNKTAKFTRSLRARNATKVHAYMARPEGTVCTTQELFETQRVRGGTRVNHSIRTAGALDLPAQDLPIDPYVLGAWLGDGSKSGGVFTNIDEPILDEIRAHHEVTGGPRSSQWYIRGLVENLRSLGVLKNKHIPDVYLRGSRAQRLAVLEGLMDTDGTVCIGGGQAEFCNTNRRIIDGVLELIASLGWKARAREGRAKLNGKDCGPKWTIKWKPSDYVFRLPRKRDKQKLAEGRTTGWHYIEKIEFVEPTPMRCITVESPSGLYLASRSMIPTHNSDLGLGLALMKHSVCQVFRREGTELRSLIDRVEEILGNRDGLGGKPPVWRNPTPTCKVIEFGSIPHLNDRQKYQGRAKDFLWFDEASNFLEDQVRFLMGWVRAADDEAKTFGIGEESAVRCMTLLTFNPPTNSDGQWIINFFAPWLDPKHPEPAKDGEIRWFAKIGDEDEFEVEDGTPFIVDDEGELRADFDPADHAKEDIIRPMSRTFISSRVSDNPYLGSSYVGVLQGLPEPLRSQMLRGDFRAGMEDDPYQVVPTSWVEEAMARWEKPKAIPVMDSLGVDVALGGRDKTVIIARHGWWFAEPIVYEGRDCTDGKKVAGFVVAALDDAAVIHLDLFGVGAQPYGELCKIGVQVVGVDVGQPARGVAEDGSLQFKNWRSELWWRVREALDPRRARRTGIALPPNRKLLADLVAPTWSLAGRTIEVEKRDAIVKRIGRSVDYGSAFCLSLMETTKYDDLPIIGNGSGEYDPYADI